jgi:hypothetical protein
MSIVAMAGGCAGGTACAAPVPATAAAVAAAAPTVSACAFPSPPAGHGAIYTDLVTAPVGAWVTVYGAGFGTAGTVTLGGTPQAVVTYGPSCVIFQVSGAGGELQVGPKAAGHVAVHKGRVLEAKPSSLRGVWSDARPGDVVYLRGGEYRSQYGEGDWYQDSTLETYKQARPAQPIALVGYPGEKPVILPLPGSQHSVIALGDGNSRQRRASNLVFANLAITGTGDCMFGGGDTTDGYGGPDETGATNIRVVNTVCTITDATNNTMTGMIATQGDGWKILGNVFHDPPNRAVIKNNHAIYIQGGADDVEVAYNQLVNLHVGHVIQIHQDGKAKLYENIHIHDNLLEAKVNTDMRGISVVEVDDASTVVIERNVLRNLGADFSGIAVYRGKVLILDNQFYGIRAQAISANGQRGGTLSIVASGNRFETVEGYPAVGAENGATMKDVRLANNRYCNTKALEPDPRPCQ